MSHAFHQLFYHVIWATHARDPHIHRSWRPQLLQIIDEEARKHGAHPIRRNAMPDHVHLLIRLPPTIALSEFIGLLKGGTSFRANREIKPRFKLVWQEGYGALTLRKDELEKVCHYIDHQEEHHKSGRVSEILERIEPDDAAGP